MEKIQQEDIPDHKWALLPSEVSLPLLLTGEQLRGDLSPAHLNLSP